MFSRSTLSLLMDRWQRRRYVSLIGHLHPRRWTWVIYSNHLSSQRRVHDIVIPASSMWKLDSVSLACQNRWKIPSPATQWTRTSTMESRCSQFPQVRLIGKMRRKSDVNVDIVIFESGKWERGSYLAGINVLARSLSLNYSTARINLHWSER